LFLNQRKSLEYEKTMNIWMQCQSFVFEWKTQYFGARLFVGIENLYIQPTHNLTIPFGSTKLFAYCSL
jgi:hypothetical protein